MRQATIKGRQRGKTLSDTVEHFGYVSLPNGNNITNVMGTYVVTSTINGNEIIGRFGGNEWDKAFDLAIKGVNIDGIS